MDKVWEQGKLAANVLDKLDNQKCLPYIGAARCPWYTLR